MAKKTDTITWKGQTLPRTKTGKYGHKLYLTWDCAGEPIYVTIPD